jgi:hypothetical protein
MLELGRTVLKCRRHASMTIFASVTCPVFSDHV